jgi:hypothetical protein
MIFAPPSVSRLVPVHILYPEHDVFRQARDLLTSGIARNRVLLVRACKNGADAERLAVSLDTLITRCRDTHQVRFVENRPRSVVLCGVAECTVWADYTTWYKPGTSVPIMLLKAEIDVAQQARQILASGFCAGTHIVLYGPTSSLRATFSLLTHLHAGVQRGSCDSVINARPGPLGLHTISKVELYTHAVYRDRCASTR